jgi:hypothetical protein
VHRNGGGAGGGGGGGGGGECCDRDFDCPIQPSTRTLTADTVKQEEEDVGDDD